jgi:hypothetical protein
MMPVQLALQAKQFSASWLSGSPNRATAGFVAPEPPPCHSAAKAAKAAKAAQRGPSARFAGVKGWGFGWADSNPYFGRLNARNPRIRPVLPQMLPRTAKTRQPIGGKYS